MLTVLAAAFPGQTVHGTGDAAFHGQALVIPGTTRATRLAANAVLHQPGPPRTGRRGRPRDKGARIGTCADAAATAHWQEITVTIYGRARTVLAAALPCLWHGSFKTTAGQLILMRDPGSAKACDPGIFTLDTALTPRAGIERYSWRRAIEPSNATGKQITGAGQACNRVLKAVERPVPFAFLIQSLVTCWYVITGDPAASVAMRRQASPWYLSKATPSAADMHAALRDALTIARINGISSGSGQTRKITTSLLASKT